MSEPRFDVGAHSEQGPRPYQEDAFAHASGPSVAVFAVADGLGGRPNGAAAGHAAVVATLLDRHADANLRNTAGNSALMTAAAQGHEPVVRALLAAGADPDLVNVDHRTARDLAALGNRQGITALLDR